MATSTLVDLTAVRVNVGGAGPLVLGAAAQACRGVEALTDGATYSYSIQQGNEYEYGRCIYVAATVTITRDPTGSSNGGSPLAVSAGSIVEFTALSDDLAASGSGVVVTNSLGQSTTSVPSQKLLTDQLAGKLNLSSVVDGLGEAINVVPTQRAVTDGLATKVTSATLAANGGAALIGVAGNFNLQQVLSTLQPKLPQAVSASAISNAERGFAHTLYNFYDSDQNTNPPNRPRLRPLGGDPTNYALAYQLATPTSPIPEPSDGVGNFLMLDQLISPFAYRAQQGDQYMRTVVTNAIANILIGLGGGNRTAGVSKIADGTYGVYAADDGAGKAYMCENWFRTLGDQDALNCLLQIIPTVLNTFKDTTVAQVDGGSGVKWSPLGIQYDTAPDGGNGQSSLYEVDLANASITAWRYSQLDGYLNYPLAMSDWLDASYKVRAPGKAAILARAVVLDPTVSIGNANGGTVVRGTPLNGDYAAEPGALDNGYAKPQRFGRANTLLNGMTSAVVLNARLWKITQQQKYLTRALGLIDAMGMPDTQGGMVITQDVTVPGCFNPDDPEIAGHAMERFVLEGLTLPGADASGRVRAAILATAAQIAADVVDGYYSADWCGQRTAPAADGLLNGFTGFQARWDDHVAKTGTANIEAGRRQGITHGPSLSMVAAAGIVAGWA